MGEEFSWAGEIWIRSSSVNCNRVQVVEPTHKNALQYKWIVMSFDSIRVIPKRKEKKIVRDLHGTYWP